MKFSILTLFPEIYDALSHSIMGRAIERRSVEISLLNIRDYSKDKHKRCDDIPYGGGVGMVMTPQPIHDAILSADPKHEALRIYLSPKGEKLNQKLAEEISKKNWLLLLNGYYEGVDQRIIDMHIDREISIGDYVLSSGDYASLVLINVLSRLVPNVLGSFESLEEESFSNGVLEYPQYTRPQNFMGLSVPTVLREGNHKEIENWRRAASICITKSNRPDLLNNSPEEC